MTLLRSALLLLLLLPAVPAAWAQADCTPSLPLPAGSILRFDASALNAFPQLVGTLSRDVALPLHASVFGLQDFTGEAVLRQPATVQQVLGEGVLGEDRALLRFGAREAMTVPVSYENRTLLLKVEADGTAPELHDVALAPLLTSPTTFTLAAGTRIRSAGTAGVVLPAGTALTWSVTAATPLSVLLRANVALPETSAPGTSARLDVIHPPRVLPGARLRIRVAAGNFDFERDPFVVCFEIPSRDKGVFSLPGTEQKLISREAGVATVEVRLPTELARKWRHGLKEQPDRPGFWDRAIGVPATLRVVGVKDQRVMLDERQTFTFASAAFAGFVGSLSVMLLAGGAAAIVRRHSGRTFTGVFLIMRNRYSLSNLQVLIWTALALFAMMYMWIGTGVLFAIPQEFLILLGISGTTSVLARAADSQGTPAGAPPPARIPQPRDLFMGADGEFELLRFQMLAFTLFAAAYSLQTVLLAEGLPQLPESLLVLMGVSSATYLGGKLPDKLAKPAEGPPAAVEQPLNDYEKSMGEADVKALQKALGTQETGGLDVATREAVRRFKVDRAIVPATGDVSGLLVRAIRNVS
jgi:hypothetical protein